MKNQFIELIQNMVESTFTRDIAEGNLISLEPVQSAGDLRILTVRVRSDMRKHFCIEFLLMEASCVD